MTYALERWRTCAALSTSLPPRKTIRGVGAHTLPCAMCRAGYWHGVLLPLWIGQEHSLPRGT